MPLRHATLRQLKIFDALANHGSVVRTAGALHLTPPAVSIQVKQLARSIGQPLIEQIGKQLHLTSHGRLVAAACRDIFNRIESLDQELAAEQGLERGTLSVAIITTASYVVPRLLGDFRAEHPGIAVAMHVGNREAILGRLEHNEDDLYILGQPPEDGRISARAFAPNLLIAVSYPGHALAGERSIGLERLAREPFLARELGSGTRLAVEDTFARAGLRPNTVMELGSNEAIKQSIAGHLGYSILSESTVRTELASGELVRLDVAGLPLKRQWYAAYPRNKILSPAATAFCGFLESRKPTAVG
ncbi:MAG: LysR family transcriptional regulator [Phyllobacteriaceae bacterium]|nr:LysR family transcriptional regulator [Phyllobacteriaceae bacterium]